MPDIPARFDPEEWEPLHSGPLNPRTFAYRRGLELVREACLAHSRPGDLWLDAGCGRGQLARALVRERRQVVRLDHDPAMLAAFDEMSSGASGVQTRFAGITGLNAPGVCSSVEKIPLRAGSFDGVAGVSLLGCLDDAPLFFEEAARLLVPGGLLIVTHTRRESVLLCASRLLARGPRPGDPISGRIRLRSTRAVMRAMEGAGFEFVDRRRYHLACDIGRWTFPSPPGAEWLERRESALGWLARNQMIVARKRTA